MPDLYGVHSPYRHEFDYGPTQLYRWGNSMAFIWVADLHK